MAYEMKELNGSLFRNDKKEIGSNQRDYNGSCKINGVDMWISAWLKTSDNGTNYMSLAFEPKQQQAPPPQQYQQQQQQPQQPVQNQGYQQPQQGTGQGYQAPPPSQNYQQPQQNQAPPPQAPPAQPPHDPNAGFIPQDDIPF